jgi:hypothetical protein
MAVPTLTPASQASAIRLPVTGTFDNVDSATNPLPFGIYTSDNFKSGAVDQVAYVYKKLGGDVLDVELTQYQVYAAYEEAVLEYSYLVNIHQAKNILSDVLGAQTGTFDHDGELKSGELSSSLGGTNVALKLPRIDYGFTKRLSDAVGANVGIGGSETIYSASISVTGGVQDYDLQQIIHSASLTASSEFYNKVDNKKALIRKVFYKSPYVMWRFFGYYGGLSVVGNLHNYGQWSDDSTFELIPTWQNKAQAMAFDDSVYTRISHYSYEIRNNKIRLFPQPTAYSPSKIWVEFSIPSDPWSEESNRENGADGVNNMNTLPFANIPYENVNSIGKQWIRRFALAISKEMLGQVRGKFQTVPIPGESVTLNHGALIDQGKTEQEKLREELKTVLDEMVYTRLAETEAAKMEAANKVQQHVPMTIFVG